MSKGVYGHPVGAVALLAKELGLEQRQLAYLTARVGGLEKLQQMTADALQILVNDIKRRTGKQRTRRRP